MNRPAVRATPFVVAWGGRNRLWSRTSSLLAVGEGDPFLFLTRFIVTAPTSSGRSQVGTAPLGWLMSFL